MKEVNPDMITVCGLDTDICVLSNVIILRSFLPETPIEVVASACAATTELKQQETLDVLQSCQITVRKD